METRLDREVAERRGRSGGERLALPGAALSCPGLRLSADGVSVGADYQVTSQVPVIVKRALEASSPEPVKEPSRATVRSVSFAS